MIPEPLHTVTIRLVPAVAQIIDEIAEREGVRFSRCVVDLVTEALAAREARERAP